MTDTQINILKAAIDWTKAEMFSSAFFALFGIMFLLASFGFWQFSKTDMAKAFVIPLLVVGGLLFILGIGLLIPNQLRLSNFPTAFNADGAAFVASEIARVDKTMNGYDNAIFRIIPLIIAVSAVLIMILDHPVWRASLITVIAMMAVILLVDINANARLEGYKTHLLSAKQDL